MSTTWHFQFVSVEEIILSTEECAGLRASAEKQIRLASQGMIIIHLSKLSVTPPLRLLSHSPHVFSRKGVSPPHSPTPSHPLPLLLAFQSSPLEKVHRKSQRRTRYVIIPLALPPHARVLHNETRRHIWCDNHMVLRQSGSKYKKKTKTKDSCHL